MTLTITPVPWYTPNANSVCHACGTSWRDDNQPAKDAMNHALDVRAAGCPRCSQYLRENFPDSIRDTADDDTHDIDVDRERYSELSVKGGGS